MVAEVLKLPDRNVLDVPRALRALADQIERGDIPCHTVAFVIDCGSGKVEVGILGPVPEVRPAAHLMFALGMRALENG